MELPFNLNGPCSVSMPTTKESVESHLPACVCECVCECKNMHWHACLCEAGGGVCVSTFALSTAEKNGGISCKASEKADIPHKSGELGLLLFTSTAALFLKRIITVKCKLYFKRISFFVGLFVCFVRTDSSCWKSEN